MFELIKTLLELKVVRYFFSGVTATLVDVCTYFIAFNFLFKKMDIPVYESYVLTAPTASLMLSFSCGLITSFLLTKYFVFTESDLKSHHQFMRFILVAFMVFVLNYFLMRILIRQFHWFPTIARAFASVSIAIISFFSHRFFTFKVNGATAEEEEIVN